MLGSMNLWSQFHVHLNWYGWNINLKELNFKRQELMVIFCDNNSKIRLFKNLFLYEKQAYWQKATLLKRSHKDWNDSNKSFKRVLIYLSSLLNWSSGDYFVLTLKKPCLKLSSPSLN